MNNTSKPEAKARELRRLFLDRIHQAGMGHTGGSLSEADILVALYFQVLSAGLYATLALRGYFPVEELSTFDSLGTRLQARPDMLMAPGVDFSTGSLGQGLSVGIGIALASATRRGPWTN